MFKMVMLAILLLLFAGFANDAQSSGYLDHYGAFLAAHVRGGVVNYAGIKADMARLDATLALMAAENPEALARPDRVALYINAYNLWTIRLIMDHWPGISSIKEAGGFLASPWKRSFVRLGGRKLSLDDIEHGILRRQYPDPRLHFVLNCASKSCPPLLSVPYRGEVLDAMLDARTRACLNDPVGARVDGGRLRLLRIFDWYAEDFGGRDGQWGFVRRFAGPALGAALDALADRRPVYDDYDWSLNDAPGPWTSALVGADAPPSGVGADTPPSDVGKDAPLVGVGGYGPPSGLAPGQQPLGNGAGSAPAARPERP
ncbi:DUF547 domain-containing protein [Solidesulfovibrio carbinolicus]|uniref:DUF547 domain-containing protein n=2 Tax=Solidesulfovibrio carbinolicus TaxID=296842 RepID=A0A4P6HKI6_9BACT|nr:DUF547 domain-containing protein [Solidesulfovibrio carbinolicus]